MFELLAEDVYVTMISVKPVAKNLCLLYAKITTYRLCPNMGRSIVCDVGLWPIRAGEPGALHNSGEQPTE